MKKPKKKLRTRVGNFFRFFGIGNRRKRSVESTRTELGGEEYKDRGTLRSYPERRTPRQREGRRRLRRAEARVRKEDEQ